MGLLIGDTKFINTNSINTKKFLGDNNNNYWKINNNNEIFYSPKKDFNGNNPVWYVTNYKSKEIFPGRKNLYLLSDNDYVLYNNFAKNKNEDIKNFKKFNNIKAKKIFSGINKFWVVNENNKLKYCNKPCDDVWYDANINSDIKTISSNINNWDNNGLADLAIRGDSISSDEFNNINDAQDKCNKLTECYAINKLPNNKFKLMSNGFAEKKILNYFTNLIYNHAKKFHVFLKKNGLINNYIFSQIKKLKIINHMTIHIQLLMNVKKIVPVKV